MGTSENTKALATSRTEALSPESCLMAHEKARYAPEKTPIH